MRVLLPLFVLAAACGGSPTPPVEVERGYRSSEGLPGRGLVAFTLPRQGGSTGFFDTPWPSERRRSGGRPDLVGYPGSEHFALRGIVREIAAEMRGFSVSPVIYLETTDVDAATWERAIDEQAVRLVDVDPTSAERGRRHPLRFRFYDRATRHVPEGLLALRPELPLAEDRLYALVVERDLPDHGTLATTRDFERVKNTAPRIDRAEEAARQSLVVTLDYLSATGLPREQVAALTVFRTQVVVDPVRKMVEVADVVPEPFQPMHLDAAWQPERDGEKFRTIVGYYCTPSFQRQPEHAPFVERGGTISLEGDLPRPVSVRGTDVHEPRCGHRMQARYVLTVPRGPRPERGWPLLVYAHGTTGDALALLGEDGFGARAAEVGMAAVSTDQPLHGSGDPRAARPGSTEPFSFHLGPFPLPLPLKGKGAELAFYNVLRPAVLRDNLRQAVVDAALLARLILATDFATAKGDDGSPLLALQDDALGVDAPRFDGERGYVAAGHSQGSQSVAMLGALDPKVAGVVLSACGGDFTTTMLGRRDTEEVATVVRLVAGLEDDELDAFHPLVALLQTIVDPADPQSFGGLYARAAPPRSVLMIQGAGDTMTIPVAADTMAATVGARPVGVLAEPLPLVAGRGLEPAPSVRGNLANGATAALLQVVPTAVYDGHFVSFREPAAMGAIEAYLRDVVGGRVPTVRTPPVPE
ncbi:MAG TPA: hypothetical protein ENK57_14565 [Polyangiaceae bacterium]|nr:hypothetical protein [Polyangiaceae bacterium]